MPQVYHNSIYYAYLLVRHYTSDDIEHYQKIVVALKETIHLMGRIDEAIEEHGGWPGDFE
jgi:hypothetical protein